MHDALYGFFSLATKFIRDDPCQLIIQFNFSFPFACSISYYEVMGVEEGVVGAQMHNQDELQNLTHTKEFMSVVCTIQWSPFSMDTLGIW